MTSDAKVGLLLGLVFIFIIAFAINGLPDFCKNSGDTKTAGVIISQNDPPGYGTKERREVIDRREPQVQFPKIQPQPAVIAQNPPSPQNPVPQTVSPPAPTAAQVAVLPVPSADSGKVIDTKIIAAAQDVASQKPQEKTNLSAAAVQAEKTERTANKIYVVNKGETLTAIAKKVYGRQSPEKVSVDNILKANSKNLKSANAIYEGQKLVIPQPAKTSLSKEKNKMDTLLLSPLLEKVESIGKKHTEDSNGQTIQNKPQTVSKPSVRSYTIKRNDTLWRIAESELGNGERYREIKKLNGLTNENSLKVGLVLKLPPK